MSENKKSAAVPDGSGDSLKSFQLSTAGIKDKSSREYGLAISKYIASTCSFNVGGYYFSRNARIIKNRNYSNGRIDIQAMFQDRFQFNSKQNYIALNWNALQIVNRIVSGLVGRWMKRNEKIVVKAVDNLSQTEKKEEYEKIEFVIDNREMLEKLQAESGVQMLPKEEGLPRDRDELNIWQSQVQRLPEEILTELGCNDVLASNGFFDVEKEKALHDAADALFVGTYTYMDNNGVIHVELIKPENAIYSWSEHNDLRNTTWRGHVPSLKISEIRRQWGKEFNPDNPFALTEKEIWEKVVPTCKEFQSQTNIGWNDLWWNSFMRPYDEWNCTSYQFEIKTVDSEPYTVTKTKTTGTTYTQKGLPTTSSGKVREKPLEGQNIIADTNWNIYRGVYLPDSQMLLEWGLKDNMIRPQDPKEIGNAEFSYSYIMPQNYMMRNLAIPEKIEAAVDGMILACLKIQQDVSLAVPPGWQIDETAFQGVDYGLGDDGNKAVDKAKLFFQTGKVFYRGIDAEGNRVPIPVQEIANTGFQTHIEAFIRTYQFWYQTLKDELGEDPSLITASIQPRVTAENVQTSQAASEEATDYIYRAYVDCMKMTARKISCLLKDSVEYGSKAYRHILKQDDIKDRIFTTDIKFLPTEQEVFRFEAMMNQALMANQDLIMFINPFQLMQVAKEDVKLAWVMFNNGQKKMVIHQQQMQRENLQMTIQGQQDSAKMAEEEKRKTKEMEVTGDIEKSKVAALANNQTAVLNLVSSLLKPAGENNTPGNIPADLKPLVNATIENIMVGAIAQSEEQKAQIMEQMQMARMQQQQTPEQQNIQQPPPSQTMAA